MAQPQGEPAVSVLSRVEPMKNSTRRVLLALTWQFGPGLRRPEIVLPLVGPLHETVGAASAANGTPHRVIAARAIEVFLHCIYSLPSFASPYSGPRRRCRSRATISTTRSSRAYMNLA